MKTINLIKFKWLFNNGDNSTYYRDKNSSLQGQDINKIGIRRDLRNWKNNNTNGIVLSINM